MMRGCKGFAAIVLGTLVGTLLGVGAHMLLQITQRSEAFLAHFTIECLTIVQTKVSMQSDKNNIFD